MNLKALAFRYVDFIAVKGKIVNNTRLAMRMSLGKLSCERMAKFRQILKLYA